MAILVYRNNPIDPANLPVLTDTEGNKWWCRAFSADGTVWASRQFRRHTVAKDLNDFPGLIIRK